MAVQPIKTSLTTQRKLSLAAGVLGALAAFISLIAPVWGFAGIGNQIVTTLSAATTVINMYFFGSTGQKIAAEKKAEEDNEKGK